MNPYQKHINYLLDNCEFANINILMRMTGISYGTLERLRDGRSSTIDKERLDQILQITPDAVVDFAKKSQRARKKKSPEPEKPQRPQQLKVQRLSSPAVEEILRRKKESGKKRKTNHHFPKGAQVSQRDIILYCLGHGGTYQTIAEALGTTAGNILNIVNGNNISQALRGKINVNMDRLEGLLEDSPEESSPDLVDIDETLIP